MIFTIKREKADNLNVGDRVYTMDWGVLHYGTLKKGKTSNGPDEYYIDYDDDEVYIIIDWFIVFKVKEVNGNDRRRGILDKNG